jgi:uncharacterized protein YndB with AHSA1/START domain
MKWVLIGLGVLIAVGALATLIGFALPQSHVASRAVRLAVPRERAWAAITNVGAYPTWRTDLQRVETLGSSPAGPSWREVGKQGTVTFEAVEVAAPAKFVARIADTGLPYGGRWEYVLAPEGTGSRLTITEHGEIYNPFFRFMARFVFGYTATMEGYMRALGKHFGETVSPEPA